MLRVPVRGLAVRYVQYGGWVAIWMGIAPRREFLRSFRDCGAHWRTAACAWLEPYRELHGLLDDPSRTVIRFALSSFNSQWAGLDGRYRIQEDAPEIPRKAV